ncbi:cysteine hydrolase family protein [Gordonia sp. DT219]|uniref:cysteine hydrolase family protein n=1 Tax=Gordonia sp. DT219 TaxID=3416658 RepID=UPI003CEA7DEA
MTTALLVIDMQNGFVHPEGSIPLAGRGLPNMDKVIAANAEAISVARSRGVPVIYTRHCYRSDFLDMPALVSGPLPADPPPLVRGSWDADVVDELAPEPGDVIVDKNRFDAFLYTDLEVVLRAKGIENLVVTGVVTSVCVESTVRSGQQRDFTMFIASDATSAPAEQHQPALDAMAAIFGTVGRVVDMLDLAMSERPESKALLAG